MKHYRLLRASLGEAPLRFAEGRLWQMSSAWGVDLLGVSGLGGIDWHGTVRFDGESDAGVALSGEALVDSLDAAPPATRRVRLYSEAALRVGAPRVRAKARRTPPPAVAEGEAA